ncbi:MAG: NUDIX domain-containing protein [Candidatus Nanopelagicales bacterium]
MGRRIACVGAVVRARDGRLLVVRRGREPARGTWSLPGGRVEAGETDPQAVAREVREETGLIVEVGGHVGTVERDAGSGDVYVIRDYAARAADGAEPTAGDDADDARWVTEDELRSLTTSPELVETLESWGLLRPPG